MKFFTINPLLSSAEAHEVRRIVDGHLHINGAARQWDAERNAEALYNGHKLLGWLDNSPEANQYRDKVFKCPGALPVGSQSQTVLTKAHVRAFERPRFEGKTLDMIRQAH